MIYRNIEIFNIHEIKENDNGSISWLRVPQTVYDNMEAPIGQMVCRGATGVELRFKMLEDTVTLRMRVSAGGGRFHVYRGSIQGRDTDHEGNKNLSTDFRDFVINKSSNIDTLKRITDDFNHPFSPEVVRVIFDGGAFELLDVIGKTVPPQKEDIPSKTILSYGSSITHGSNALDSSHSWTSIVAHNLKMDLNNLGMAGSCRMEPEMVDFLAQEGEKGNWDIALLELGINALDWEEEKIIERCTNTITQIAGRNPQKKIFVISPFYCMDDYNNIGKAQKWRSFIEQTVSSLNYDNVTYINGLSLLGDMSLISADEVHPNIYGADQIAHRLTETIKPLI